MKEYIPDKAATKDTVIGYFERFSGLRSSILHFVLDDNLDSEQKPKAAAIYGPMGCGKSYILDAVLNEAVAAAKDAGKKLYLKDAEIMRMRGQRDRVILEFEKYMKLLKENPSYRSIIVINPADGFLFPPNNSTEGLSRFLSRPNGEPANMMYVLEATYNDEKQFDPGIRARMDLFYAGNSKQDMEKILRDCCLKRHDGRKE